MPRCSRSRMPRRSAPSGDATRWAGTARRARSGCTRRPPPGLVPAIIDTSRSLVGSASAFSTTASRAAETSSRTSPDVGAQQADRSVSGSATVVTEASLSERIDTRRSMRHGHALDGDRCDGSDAVSEIQEHVRDRYAKAALTVLDSTSAAAECCGGSSCGATVLDDSSAPFGAGLYDAGQVEVLPTDAVLASLGCGNPLAVAELQTVNASWIWARAAASTCCCPPAGWARPASRTAWT